MSNLRRLPGYAEDEAAHAQLAAGFEQLLDGGAGADDAEVDVDRPVLDVAGAQRSRSAS